MAPVTVVPARVGIGVETSRWEDSELQELLELPKKPPMEQWPQANMEFHWIYPELVGLRGFFPSSSQKFLKDKEVLQEKKVTRIFLKKGILGNINTEISTECLYSIFPVCCWFYINRYHWLIESPTFSEL